jgi:hypothetical protein
VAASVTWILAETAELEQPLRSRRQDDSACVAGWLGKPEGDGKMEWMLVCVIVSMTSDRVASPITVPVASEKLCEEAKTKLMEA